MDEREFIYQLQQRAKKQKQTLDAVPFPKVFAFVIEWLSVHPWRYLIPLAFVVSFLFRWIFGIGYTNFILSIFRYL